MSSKDDPLPPLGTHSPTESTPTLTPRGSTLSPLASAPNATSRPPSFSISSVHFAPTATASGVSSKRTSHPPSLDSIKRDLPTPASPSSAGPTLTKARSAAPLSGGAKETPEKRGSGQYANSLSRSPSLPPPRRHPRVQSESTARSTGGGFRRPSVITGGYESSSSGSGPSKSPVRAAVPGAQRPLSTSSTLSTIQATSPRRNLYPRSRLPQENDTPSKMSSRQVSRAPSNGRDITSSPDPRKGKERANGLAASLGIDSFREGLTSDQINNLLNDTDVVSALRMMNNSNLAARLSASRQDVSSPISLMQSKDPPPPNTEPFVVRAPPAQFKNDDEPGQLSRDRNVSDASTLAPTMTNTWTSTSNGDMRLRTASMRKLSRSETVGGHIPFTHPTPITQVDEDVTTEGDAEEERPMGITNGLAVELQGADSSSKSSLAAKRKSRHRISNLFHLKKRIPSQPTEDTEAHSHVSRSDREELKSKEKVEQERDEEMRRKESQRREEELLQGEWKGFKVLMLSLPQRGASELLPKSPLIPIANA